MEKQKKPDPDAWKAHLEVDAKTGRPLPTAINAELILKSEFKDILAYDASNNIVVIKGPLPWRDRESPDQEYEPWLGSDYNRMQHYLDKTYGFRSEKTIKNAFIEVTRRNSFHPIKDRKKQKEPLLGNRMKAALEYLGDSYKIKMIDKEDCIYIYIGNGYDIEVSGIAHSRKGVCNYVCVWNMSRRLSVDYIWYPQSLLELKHILDSLVSKYGRRSK
ncbi:hypothetical protein [Acetivibrio cellulolyticus]|uniref:hypothetical protein n=1 Tax=Acetivibrio cellulolyticus TaxID=35830 RepID=UPI0001E2D96F|nr:hypothetical protein [Acetivibrio cellulolyticus]